jgi:hypothetical protein
MEITMKSKLIVACACLGILGGTLACAGEEEAMTASDESAAPLSEAGEADEGPSGEAKQLTNADCFATSAPDSASQWAKSCIDMAKSHPDMPFTPNDYRGMPEDCKPFVKPKCR